MNNQINRLSINQKFLSLLIPMTIIGSLVSVFTWNKIENKEIALQVILVIMLGVGLVSVLTSVVVVLMTRNLKNLSHSITESIEYFENQIAELSIHGGKIKDSSFETVTSLKSINQSIIKIDSAFSHTKNHTVQADEQAKGSQNFLTASMKENEKLEATMLKIFSDSKSIEEILKMIQEISFQTNLLSLNAAVEAARAGEQGKSFAVVADAVSGLASKSSSFTSEISQIINIMGSSIGSGKSEVETNTQRFLQISEMVTNLSYINQKVTTAVESQSQLVQSLHESFQQVERKSAENLKASQEISEASIAVKNEISVLKNNMIQLNQMVNG